MKSKHLLLLVSLSFIGVLIHLGMASAAACDSTLSTQGCTISTNVNLTLVNGVYNMNSTNGMKAIYMWGGNSTLDCNGSTIYGNYTTGSFGIYSDQSNSSIINCIFYGYDEAVHSQNNLNLRLYNITTYNSSGTSPIGIKLFNSNNSILESLNINKANSGLIFLQSSFNTTISDSYFISNDTDGSGIRILTSGNTIIKDNLFYNSSKGVYLDTQVNGVTLFNNTFERNRFALYTDNDFNNNINISNNIYNNTLRVIYSQNISNLYIYENLLYNSDFAYFINGLINATISYNNITSYDTIFADKTASQIFINNSDLQRENVLINRNRIFNSSKSFIDYEGKFNNLTIINNIGSLNYVDSVRSGNFIYQRYLNETSKVYIRYNSFSASSALVWFENSNATVYFEYNNLSDASRNGDSYNGGINIVHSSNMIVNNNNLVNMGCYGVLVQGGSNHTFTNNYLNFSFVYNLINNINCAYENPSAFHVFRIWKNWLSDNSETADMNVSDILVDNSENITILNNTIEGFPVLLKSSVRIGLIHDLEDYYLINFAAPNYLYPRVDYYVSNNYENISTTFNQTNNNPVTMRDLLGNGWMGSTINPKIEYKIHKEWLYFYNSNDTVVYNISLFERTNALIFNTNNSLLCNGLVTGNCNITLPPGNASCAFDNANLTEGVSRGSGSCVFPLTVTRSTTFSRTVNNNLPENLEGNTLIFTVSNCNGLGVITSDSQTWNNGDYQCSGNQLILTDVTLDSGNTDFDFNYGCTAFEQTGYLLIQIAGALLVLAGSIFFLWKTGLWEQMTVGQLVVTFIIIVVAISLFLASADIIAQRCAV